MVADELHSSSLIRKAAKNTTREPCPRAAKRLFPNASCLGWLILVLWFLPSAFSGPAICFLPNKRHIGSNPCLICSEDNLMVGCRLELGLGIDGLLALSHHWESAAIMGWQDFLGFGLYYLRFRAMVNRRSSGVSDDALRASVMLLCFP